MATKESPTAEHLKGWFQPKLTRWEAKHFLFQQRSANFVVRLGSARLRDHVLSLRLDGEIRHIRIVQTNNDYHFLGDRKFSSIAKLVWYYSSDRHPLKLPGRSVILQCSPSSNSSKRPMDEHSFGDTDDTIWDPRQSMDFDRPLYQVYEAAVHVREFKRQHPARKSLKQYAHDSSLDPRVLKEICRNLDHLDDEEIDESFETIKEFLTTMSQRVALDDAYNEDTSPEPNILSECKLLSETMQAQVGVRRHWADAVKERHPSLLKKLTKSDKMIQESLFEILTSEASYLKSLNVIHNHFMENLNPSKGREDVLQKHEYHTLFSNIVGVTKVSNRLMTLWDAQWRRSCVLSARTICPVLTDTAEQSFEEYVKYVGNQPFQINQLKKLISDNPTFKERLRGLEQAADCHKQELFSFLTLPMQRLTRMPLLIEAVLRRLTTKEDGFHETQRCLIVLQKIVKQANEKVRELENLEKMTAISNKLEFKQNVKQVAIVSASRVLVKTGDVHRLPSKSGKADMITLILFDDLLLIVKKKSDERYLVIDSASSTDLRVEQDLQLPLNASQRKTKFLFRLLLLDANKNREYILACGTAQEKIRWIQALNSKSCHQDNPSPSRRLFGDEASLQQVWGYRQVQITRQYEAKETDELPLRIGDVIIITEETDGWLQGERIRDGESGWFPADLCDEIKDLHARIANVQKYERLIQHDSSRT